MRVPFLTACLLVSTILPLRADYVVDFDLGNISLGSTQVVGTTAEVILDPGPPEIIAGGRNNIFFPGPPRLGAWTINPAFNWGHEVVYQFDLDVPAVIQLQKTSEFISDPDFFLLDGLSSFFDPLTAKDGAAEVAAIGFLDGIAPQLERLGAFRPGRYYLAVENALGPIAGEEQDAIFDFTMELTPATSQELERPIGIVGVEGESISIDTFGSDYDTQLGLYDRFGNIVAVNDDASDGLQSALSFPSGLDAGTYIAVVAGSGAEFQPLETVSAGGEVGNFLFNVSYGPNVEPGQFAGSTTEGNSVSETQFFVFAIAEKPAAEDLGEVGTTGEPVVFNTEGSQFDTELALFDSHGNLWALNDDLAQGNVASEVALLEGLPAGSWYLVLGGYPHLFFDGLVAEVDTQEAPFSQGGPYQLNYGPGAPRTGSLSSNTAKWFTFEIREPVGRPIQITSLHYDSQNHQFTVAWETGADGPFNIMMGNADDMSFIEAAPDNILPNFTGTFDESPATVTIPPNLRDLEQVFLQVTD